jgi:2-phospho-L-lactate/phosphoenolpyruvate guanylyltransferase
MRTAAILPVKRFSQAKQRLGESVGDPLRSDLAQAMVGDVLRALGECDAIAGTIVVTDEPSASAAARAQGAMVIEDSPRDGQSAAVSLGIRFALDRAFERVLCVPGDCPTLDPLELDALLKGSGSSGTGAAEASAVVIVPDRHGTGTNALLLSPPDAIQPSFGPGSCARHRALADSAGLSYRLARPASLLLDIDTGEDLLALRSRLAGAGGRAPRTRAVLDRGRAEAHSSSRAAGVASATAL